MTDKYRWKILIAASLSYITYAFCAYSITPVLGILIDTFHISYTQAGLLMSLLTFPAIFLSIPGGMLVDRFGMRKTGTISLLVLLLGTVLVATASDYLALILGRFMVGMGAIMLLITTSKAINVWFIGHEIGLAMGVYNAVFPLGVILAQNLSGPIALGMGWQATIWTSAVFVLVSLLLYIILVRDKKTQLVAKPKSIGIFTVIKQAGWRIWCVGISLSMFGAAMISYFTYAPNYFLSSGKDFTQAGLSSSAPMLASIIIAPLAGMVIDRLGKKKLFVVIGFIGLAVALFLIPRLIDYSTVIAIIMGLFIAILTPSLFSIPVEILPLHVGGMGFGIIYTCQGLGQSLGPAIAGLLRDTTGDYTWSFVLMAILALLGTIPMIVLATYGSSKKTAT